MSLSQYKRLPVAAVTALALATGAVAVPQSPIVGNAFAQEENTSSPKTISTFCQAFALIPAGIIGDVPYPADPSWESELVLDVSAPAELTEGATSTITISNDSATNPFLITHGLMGFALQLGDFVPTDSTITLDVEGDIELVNPPEGITYNSETKQIIIKDYLSIGPDSTKENVMIGIAPINLEIKPTSTSTVTISPSATIAVGAGDAVFKPGVKEELGIEADSIPVDVECGVPGEISPLLSLEVAEATPIADEYDPSYEAVPVTAGEEATAPALDIEDGAEVTSDAPDWITIDPATGAATITPAEDAAEGTTTVNVTVTYSDGSTDTLQLVVNVEAAQTDEPDAGGSLGSGDLGSLFGSDSSSTDGSSSLGIFGIIATILAILGLGGWAWYEWDQNNNRR